MPVDQQEATADAALEAEMARLGIEDDRADETADTTAQDEGGDSADDGERDTAADEADDDGSEADADADDTGDSEGSDTDDDGDGADTGQLTDKQREAAKALGLDDADIAALGETAGPVIEKAASRHFGALSKVGHKLKAAREGKKADADEAGEDDGKEIELADFSDADFDAYGDGKPVEKLNQVVKHNRALAQRLERLERDLAAREEAETATEVDGFFKALDVKDYPQFGKGRTKALTAESEPYLARQELIEEAAVLRLASTELGRDMSLQGALDRALIIVAPNQQRAAMRRKLTEGREKRKHATGTRPGGPKRTLGKDTEAAADRRLMVKATELGIKIDPT